MTTNRNKDLVMCSEVEAGNFTTMLHTVILNVGKSVLKVTETLWENSLIILKDVYANLLFQLHFLRKKKTGCITFVLMAIRDKQLYCKTWWPKHPYRTTQYKYKVTPQTPTEGKDTKKYKIRIWLLLTLTLSLAISTAWNSPISMWNSALSSETPGSKTNSVADVKNRTQIHSLIQRRTTVAVLRPSVVLRHDNPHFPEADAPHTQHTTLHH
jgi:hypothetical protein